MAIPMLKTGKHLDSKDLHGYLKTLPPAVLDRLYNYPATCLAVFRELPVLSQHFVMRLLFIENPVTQAVVRSWVISTEPRDFIAATKALSDLRVWCEQSLQAGLPGWMLNQTFRAQLKVALMGGGEPWIGSGALAPDKHSRDAPFLDNYAMERWECILHYMVGSKDGVSGVSKDVRDILDFAGLMKQDSASGEAYITPGGFQFLLMDTASQVWFFMLQYLDTAERRQMDLVESLAFLFQLSFFSLGKDYSIDGISEGQMQLIQHLREFGLVYQRKRSSQRFYPTRLAVNLASGLSKTNLESQKDGFLVVETNYRVYAYTSSSLQVALLALFCDMLYRFPNLTVAQVTRDSVREALFRGITAEQIINFLRSHAHPQALKKTPVIPPAISDMIRLWELERDRFKFSEGVLYSQFMSQADFEMLRNYAQDIGVCVWDIPAKRVMVVTRGGHDDVKRFWKRNKP